MGTVKFRFDEFDMVLLEAAEKLLIKSLNPNEPPQVQDLLRMAVKCYDDCCATARLYVVEEDKSFLARSRRAWNVLVGRE